MRFISFAMIIASMTASAMAKEAEPITLDVGHRYQIESSILKESRELLIHLPDGYQETEKHYPVLYVLDGNGHFNHAAAAVELLKEQSMMPDSIIVAIPNNTRKRGRDLGDESDNFKRFIKDEVIAYIEKQYRTTCHRTIFGHSMAGAFVMSVLATEAELFDNYIAASPVIQIKDSELLPMYEKLFSKDKNIIQSLYFTLTERSAEGNAATDALNSFVKLLKKSAPDSFNWHYQYIPGQVHMTTPYLTMYQGLTRAYSDFRAPSYVSYQDYRDRGGVKGLEAFFAKRADKYQTAADVPERTVRGLAFDFMDSEPEQAIKIFLANSKKHPQSPGALFGLGRGYENMQQQQEALHAYQAALALAEKQSARSVGFLKREVARFKKIIAEH